MRSVYDQNSDRDKEANESSGSIRPVPTANYTDSSGTQWKHPARRGIVRKSLESGT